MTQGLPTSRSRKAQILSQIAASCSIKSFIYFLNLLFILILIFPSYFHHFPFRSLGSLMTTLLYVIFLVPVPNPYDAFMITIPSTLNSTLSTASLDSFS